MGAQSAMVTFTRAVTVAAGVFAPGHLGELTQFVPFELADEVLAQTKTVQRRVRDLPSRAGVYFLLALGLFEVLAGPLAWPYAPGVAFGGLRTVAFDGCSSLRFPDTGRNRAWLGRIRHPGGFAGYPALRLMTLAETGTRGLLGAVIGAAADGDEPALARQLLHLLGPGMLLLADRAYDSGAFLGAVAASRAQFLVRGKASRSPAVLQILPDGSYLSQIGGLDVRVIDADVTAAGCDGSRTGDRYRLITTLLDHRRFPADRLTRLYHERWEIESAYYALRHTLLQGRVLRSGDRPGAEQETWALLALYQLLRMAMTDATAARPGTDPDRASFTTALEAARDQLTAAAGICPDGPADLPGVIGRAVLATLLPARRPRFSARKVKCATSRYLNHGDQRPHAVTAITAIIVTVRTPPLRDSASGRRPHRRTSALIGPRRPTRRELITAIITSQPPRDWSGHELAVLLKVKPRNMLTQLGEWARLGFFTHTGFGTYRLKTPSASTASTAGPDP